MKTKLFTPIKLRDLEIKNRIWMSPMCQYSAVDGVPQKWHQVHYGTRATGGAGLVMVEATGVSPEARISAQCLALWNSQQLEAFKPITQFVETQGAFCGIQLAHAGRKAGLESLGIARVAPSPLRFQDSDSLPIEIDDRGFQKISADFRSAAERALSAGFKVVEIHAAHGYLLHSFLSPLSNLRKDDYGGSLQNRMRFPLQIAAEVRKIWPIAWPVFVRISASDWVEGGWDLASSIEFCKELAKIGIDLVDVSSGGLSLQQKIVTGPGYQVSFADEIRKKCQIPVAAVGMITNALQAEQILQENQADAVFLARELLRNPYFPFQAARELGEIDLKWPFQYERARS
jgi:2,4-dienoyl-CoA reductase-like NADH-dependent reductase (Old Yellow Enzyme family)